MPRCLCVALAAWLSLAGSTPVHSQDVPTGSSSAGPTPSTLSPETDVTKLQAENAALKKEVSDAANTIAQLQAQLAQAGLTHQVAAPPEAESAQNAPASTNVAPARALPLDATNTNETAATPTAEAGPSRSYTVVKGDSIWKIAHKMYPGDTKNGVDKIQEANKDAIGNKPLKIGQVLVIPQ